MVKLEESLEEVMPEQGQILVTSKDETTWLSLKDALNIVNMEKTAFYYYRDKPDGVRSRKARNNRDKQYNAADIKRLKARREELAVIYAAEEYETDLRWLVPGELPAILKLDFEVYAEYLVGDPNLYASWITKNTNVALCAFSKTDPGKCLAYISALPLPEQTILQILKGERCELDITADEILTYDQPGEYTLLVNSVVASEEKYLSKVLKGVLDFWIGNAPERKIKRLYAESTSERGRSLLRKFYFSELAVITSDNTLAPIEDAYYLDLQKPVQSKLIRHFQNEIKAKS